MPSVPSNFGGSNSKNSCDWDDDDGDSDSDSDNDSDSDDDDESAFGGDSDSDVDEDDEPAESKQNKGIAQHSPPRPRIRRVSFHPTHMVEVHFIERVEIQDYTDVYYCVHELQKMMDDFRLETENSNPCAPVRI